MPQDEQIEGRGKPRTVRSSIAMRQDGLRGFAHVSNKPRDHFPTGRIFGRHADIQVRYMQPAAGGDFPIVPFFPGICPAQIDHRANPVFFDSLCKLLRAKLAGSIKGASFDNVDIARDSHGDSPQGYRPGKGEHDESGQPPRSRFPTPRSRHTPPCSGDNALVLPPGGGNFEPVNAAGRSFLRPLAAGGPTS